jgi:polyisoprenoid-binding protein YceI
MRKWFSVAALAVLLLSFAAASPARAADDYTLDAMHAGVNFKISHLGLSWTYGRFNDVSGAFTIDESADKCAFSLTLKTDSVDTGNKKRDEHLKAPDFFNAKQYPTITFKSTSVKAAKGGYEVTGDLTLHGKSKSVTFTLVGGRKAELPKGVHRTGFSTELVIKRSDFGMDKMTDAIGDEVYVSISFEGTKK